MKRWEALASIVPLPDTGRPEVADGMENIARFVRLELDSLGLNLDDDDVLYTVLSTLTVLVGCTGWAMPLEEAVNVSAMARAIGASLAHLAPPEAGWRRG